MTAAMQLHKDACLMNTNLDILDQYALALHGTASKILQKTIGGSPYPRAEVAAEAQGPRARRASVHMEALGGSLEALDGPDAVRHALLQEQHPGRLKRIILTFGVFCKV